MIQSLKKRKFRIEKIQVTQKDRVRTFEIQLPANISKIISITVTANI